VVASTKKINSGPGYVCKGKAFLQNYTIAFRMNVVSPAEISLQTPETWELCLNGSVDQNSNGAVAIGAASNKFVNVRQRATRNAWSPELRMRTLIVRVGWKCRTWNSRTWTFRTWNWKTKNISYENRLHYNSMRNIFITSNLSKAHVTRYSTGAAN